MRDFARVIAVHNGLTAHFIFTVLHSSTGSRYYVSALDGNIQSYIFTMEQTENHSWKIINAPKLPQWIMEIETRLEEAILENINALS